MSTFVFKFFKYGMILINTVNKIHTNMSLYSQIHQALLHWYDQHGRKNLPWQSPRDPYKVWISEIMLQQTQVQTVIPYFNRFLTHFPSINHLAEAKEDQVLSLWSGLGYYTRARNLHQAAKIINTHYQGQLPNDQKQLMSLPGIGQSTAAAIMSQAFNEPIAILDGNVKRVLTRVFRIEGWPEQSQIKNKLWDIAQLCMPQQRCADYTQAIMDLGATCCTIRNPNCLQCPLQAHCLAFLHQEQHCYPTKKIKKDIPIQHQQLLVLYNASNQIYLEKRPATGIWGGLWCLPNINKEQCALTFIEQHYQLQGEPPKQLTAFKHRFTHFHLEINAIAIRTQVNPKFVTAQPGQWFHQEELTHLGLARPTSKILHQHFSST